MADIQLLRTFLAVYRSGTFTRAADDLRVTQPAVSLHIRTLEKQIGKPLFLRGPRGVTPTSSGRELAQAVATHVDSLEGVLEQAAGSFDAVGESIHIGGPEELLTERVMPELLNELRSGLRIRMFFGVNRPVIARLESGELDLAVLTSDPNLRGIDTQPFCYEYLDLVGSPAWAKKLGTISADADGAKTLSNIPVAAYDEDLPLVRPYWQAVFHSAPNLRAQFVSNGLRPCLSFALKGLGITVLPSHMSEKHIQEGTLVKLLTPIEPSRTRMHLAWRAGSLRRTSLARVHEHLSKAALTW